MGAIDIGSGAANYNSASSNLYTYIDEQNPANLSGILDTFEVWFLTNATGFKVGTFSGSNPNYTMRDYEYIGNVTAASKQTFTGKNCDVTGGDFIGFYTTTGDLEANNPGGVGTPYVSGDKFNGNTYEYSYDIYSYLALYATGIATASPTVTTQAASSVTSNSCTGNGNITAIGGANATRRGFAYKVGTTGDPTVADSIAYDDGDFGTGAYTKTISPLKLGTHYRVAAYATNSVGTSYGSTVEVFTPAENILGIIT
jgi:hypothetical protein